MEELLGLILEVILEVVIQLFADGSTRRWKGWSNLGPVVRALVWGAVGAGLGALSLVFFPHSLIKSELLRLVHLGAAPVVAGFTMAFVGRLRRSRDKEDTDLETFAVGFAFALGLGLVRFLVAG